jgi:hypothetical protein
MVGRVLRPAPEKSDALILDHAGAVFQHGFVDDEIVWALHGDDRAENRSHTSRKNAGCGGLTNCPECRAIRFPGRPCGVCGWRARPRAASVEIADGELGEVDRDRSVRLVAQDRLGFYRQLLWIAAERGYALGWAAHKFKEKFGGWPDPNCRGTTPIPPEDATRSWVRSRMIAYARAMQKVGAA